VDAVSSNGDSKETLIRDKNGTAYSRKIDYYVLLVIEYFPNYVPNETAFHLLDENTRAKLIAYVCVREAEKMERAVI
jgi:hypothetical protein